VFTIKGEEWVLGGERVVSTAKRADQYKGLVIGSRGRAKNIPGYGDGGKG